MFKKTVIALIAIIGVFAGYVALQPSEFRITRSTIIEAPASIIFAQINDFHKWQDWSPWAKIDPAAITAFEGPEAGKGAIFKWSGNDKIGQGTMTLTESSPDEAVRTQVDFTQPFEGTTFSEFQLKPEGNRTTLTWTMSGHNNFIARAICVFMPMEKMLGGEMEMGLVGIKAIAEAANRN